LALRTRVEQLEAKGAEQQATQVQLTEQIMALRRSLLDLNNQLEQMRAEMARLRGQDEQLVRDVADLQRMQKDIRQGVDDRIRKLEPQKVAFDGREFLADADEQRQFEAAMDLVRKGEFAAASTALSGFMRRFPASGYTPSVLYWLGNSQYGQRLYKEAMASFRSLVTLAPDHVRSPDALLSVATCQIELKDSKAARRTLEELLKTYPKSEAVLAAKDRLAALK
jgi:tol-pal system protein YbgF